MLVSISTTILNRLPKVIGKLEGDLTYPYLSFDAMFMNKYTLTAKIC